MSEEKTYNLYRWATIGLDRCDQHVTLDCDFRGGSIVQIYNEAGRREVTVVTKRKIGLGDTGPQFVEYKFIATSLLGEIEKEVRSKVGFPPLETK